MKFSQSLLKEAAGRRHLTIKSKPCQRGHIERNFIVLQSATTFPWINPSMWLSNGAVQLGCNPHLRQGLYDILFRHEAHMAYDLLAFGIVEDLRGDGPNAEPPA